MLNHPVIVSLPIADRPTSFAFYQTALGFEATGDLGADGIPEPLQFVLDDNVRLMLIPAGGFGWVIGDNDVVGQGQSECLMGLTVETNAEVDGLLAQAEAAGASIAILASQKPWGYAGTFADPDGHLWAITSRC